MKLWMWALLGLGGLWIFSQMNRSQSFLPGFSPGQPTGNGVGVSGTLRFGNGWTGSATLGNSSPISTGSAAGSSF